MIRISVEDTIREKCPDLRIAVIECPVKNSDHSPELWKQIDLFCEKFRTRYNLEDINKRPAIRETRQAYKALGKDPNRYRPSAEALCRRICKGMPLYRINTLVDLINLVSLRSGYSIGGFDADLIRGDLRLGVGQAGEEFHAIGRGTLNIEGLPVYRDEAGAIGTPTSDEERTKIHTKTSRLLMIVNAYSGAEELEETLLFIRELLSRFLHTKGDSEFQINLY